MRGSARVEKRKPRRYEEEIVMVIIAALDYKNTCACVSKIYNISWQTVCKHVGWGLTKPDDMAITRHQYIYS